MASKYDDLLSKSENAFNATVTTSTDADPNEPCICIAGYVQVGKPLTGLKPHKCPVCEGRGLMCDGFYIPDEEVLAYKSTKQNYEQCRSCKGAGYLLIA